MDEKLSELCEKVDAITESQADFESRMKKELAGVKEQVQQVTQTQSQPPQTLEMEMCLKKDLNDQMSLLAKRYFNCSNTNELMRKVGAGLESYFHSIGSPLQNLSGPNFSSSEGNIKVSDIDYESLPFLNSNETEKHLYSIQNIINLVGNDFKKSKPSWMRFNYLQETQEVGTEIITQFCKLLKVSLHKGIYTYTSFEWSNYCTNHLKMKSKSIFDVDTYDMVLIPIIKNGHYFSIHIHGKDHCIYILDSLYVDINKDHLQHLTYVVNILIGSKKFLDNAWSSYYVKNNPKQDNVFDCGIYMAKYMEYWGKK